MQWGSGVPGTAGTHATTLTTVLFPAQTARGCLHVRFEKQNRTRKDYPSHCLSGYWYELLFVHVTKKHYLCLYQSRVVVVDWTRYSHGNKVKKDIWREKCNPRDHPRGWRCHEWWVPPPDPFSDPALVLTLGLTLSLLCDNCTRWHALPADACTRIVYLWRWSGEAKTWLQRARQLI